MLLVHVVVLFSPESTFVPGVQERQFPASYFVVAPELARLFLVCFYKGSKLKVYTLHFM